MRMGEVYEDTARSSKYIEEDDQDTDRPILKGSDGA